MGVLTPMLKTLQLRENFDALFGATPARLYANRALESVDRDVFGAISMCLLGNTGDIEIRQREIAEFLGISERTIRRSVARLLKEKELIPRRNRLGANSYRLGSPLFSKGRLTGTAPGALPTISHQSCQKCQRKVKMLGRSGWCRACAADAELASLVSAARVELGPGATPEQLAAHLKNSRLAAKIRRMLERAA